MKIKETDQVQRSDFKWMPKNIYFIEKSDAEDMMLLHPRLFKIIKMLSDILKYFDTGLVMHTIIDSTPPYNTGRAVAVLPAIVDSRGAFKKAQYSKMRLVASCVSMALNSGGRPACRLDEFPWGYGFTLYTPPDSKYQDLDTRPVDSFEG